MTAPESFTRLDLIVALRQAQERAAAEHPRPTDGGSSAEVIADMERERTELRLLRDWLCYGTPITGDES